MTYAEVTSHDELRALLGQPGRRSVEKERARLHPVDRQWLAASPFCLVATSGADGTCDVSPKGDPPGFTRVLDDTTIAIPERPGNKRADGFHNSRHPTSADFFVPGRDDTRGSTVARTLRDGRSSTTWWSRPPPLALVVEIERSSTTARRRSCGRVWKPTPAPEAMRGGAARQAAEAPGAPRRARTALRPRVAAGSTGDRGRA